jgi:mRNA interferase MazF
LAISEIETHSSGDVVVVPFPYSDRMAEKRRPALVISNQRLATQGYVWLAMITSAAHPRAEHDVAIDQPARAGLAVRCVVRPTKITCIEPARIVRRIGKLSQAEIAAACDAVRSFIGS